MIRKTKALFTDVVTQTGVADPIAISKSTNEKGIKIMRSVADDLDLAKLLEHMVSKFLLVMVQGGTGTKSMGFGFEDVFKDLNTYIEEGVDSPNFKYPDFMKDFHSQVLSKHSEITVSLDGGANTVTTCVYRYWRSHQR